MTDAQKWAGERLGLPESGPGSLAKIGRRMLALAIDWALAMLVSQAFAAGDSAITLGVFALMHLLGFRFAPRIRDLGDTKLFIPKGDTVYDALKPMISSDRLNIKRVVMYS